MEKINKILDGPRVRGGRSAVHEILSPEALQKGFSRKIIVADGPRSSVHPVGFGYTGGVSSVQVADGPPKVRGQFAGIEKSCSRGSFREDLCRKLQRRTVRYDVVDGPRLRRTVEPDTRGLIWPSLSL